MAFYKDREQYNRQFAETQYQVLHNKPASTEDETPRQSFFRINEEEELVAACANWIHFPCMTMVGLSGGLINKKDSIRQQNTNAIIFLSKLQLDQNNPIKATALTEAYELTLGVMADYIAKLLNDFEEDECGGIFKDLDASSFKWEQYGPVGDGELYGWILSFSDEVKPSITYNPAHFV